MKKAAAYIFLFYFSIATFCQTVNKKAYSKDSALKQRLDTLIDRYEKTAINFYHQKKYDTAIVKFIKAKCYLDTLFSIRGINSDYVNFLVTKCNLALCYCLKRKFSKGMQELPAESFGENKVWGENKYDAIYNLMKMDAFIHFTAGDCQVVWKDPRTALSRYITSYQNLNHYKFPDSIPITYNYAIKTYIYKPSFKKVLFSWGKIEDDSTSYDSLTIIKCINSVNGISRDK